MATSSTGASEGAAAEEAIPDIAILSVKECFVYKVPPLSTASGHRAEDWQLDKPLLTGSSDAPAPNPRYLTLSLIIHSTFKNISGG